MGKIISVFIRKGGSGKTTTAINLASGLAKKGKKVLLVDLDTQANATLGLQAIDDTKNIGKVLSDKMPAKDAIKHLGEFDILPATTDLVDNEQELTIKVNPNSFYKVKSVLEPIKNLYDYIIIDTAPSQGILGYNAILATDGAIIPVEMQTLATKGLSQTLDLIDSVQPQNPTLELIGILPTKVQARTNLAVVLTDDLKTRYKDKVLPMSVPFTVKVPEAQLLGKSLLDYDPASDASKAYEELAQHVINYYER